MSLDGSHHKAARNRENAFDLGHACPLPSRRLGQWLREALARYDPAQPWNDRLADA